MVVTRSQSSNNSKSDKTDSKKPSNSQSEKSRTTAKARSKAGESPTKPSDPRKQRKGTQLSSTSPTKKYKPTVKIEQQQELDTSGEITPPTPTTAKATTGPTILINRAPVLHLWSACVAQFLYIDISWPTSLAIGSAIATLCAISKGRSIGKIDPADPDKQAEKARKRRQTAESAHDRELNVMGFPIHVRDERVMVQGKPKTANEDALKAKFSNEKDYDVVKGAMERALMGWKGREGELDKSAFGMYEKFRPVVQPGQRGWGRKGELRVEDINEVVRKE